MTDLLKQPMRLPGDDGVSDPDRSSFFVETNPVVLRDQLNENWRQTRLMGRALTDRDQVIADLNETVKKLEKTNDTLHTTIAALQKRLRLSNRVWPVIYAACGGAGAELTKLSVEYGVHRWAFHFAK